MADGGERSVGGWTPRNPAQGARRGAALLALLPRMLTLLGPPAICAILVALAAPAQADPARERAGVGALQAGRDVSDATAAAHYLDGVALTEAGKPAEAERCFRAARPLLRAGDRPRPMAALDHALGVLSLRTGHPGEARRHLREALRGRRVGEDLPGEATTLTNLALACEQQGELALAQAHLERARDLLAGLHRDVEAAYVDGLAAAVRLRRGDTRAGRAALKRSLERLAKAKAARNASLVWLRASAAWRTRGRTARALEAAECAGDAAAACDDEPLAHAAREAFLHASVGAGCRDPEGLAAPALKRHATPTAWANLAVLSTRAGDLPQARRWLQRAVVEAGRRGQVETEAQALVSLAAVQLQLGDAQAAGTSLRSAEALIDQSSLEALRGHLLWGLAAEAARRGARSEARTLAAHALRLIAAQRAGLDDLLGPRTGAALHPLRTLALRLAFEAGDARGALETIDRTRARVLVESMRAHRGPRLELSAPLAARIQSAEAAVGRAREARRSARARGHLPRARKASRALRAAQTRHERVLSRAQRVRRLAASDLVGDEAPASPRPEDLLRPHEVMVLQVWMPRRVHALVVTTKSVRLVDLGTRERAASACAALATPDFEAKALQEARNVLVKPLGLRPDARVVLMSPEGPGWRLPLGALFPDRDVAVLASPSVLAVLNEERAHRGRSVLALADPGPTGVDSADTARAPRGPSLPPLPSARKEARHLADHVLAGGDARESDFIRLASSGPRRRALHLACHGLHEPDRPELDALVLAPSAEADGHLGLLEVSGMRMQTDLVGLSACDTARGTVHAGEGLVCLAHGFLAAGGTRVLGSLWKVDDEATRALMIRFHELWNPPTGKGRGLPAAQALRQAQGYVRSQPKWAAPRYWAAWVLFGVPSG